MTAQVRRPYLFNRNPVTPSGSIEQPDDDVVKNTLSLWNASVEDAARYGGELTRSALGAMSLRNDRKYVVVDTKVHMLMPGFYPAIPGWHTDGAPRGESGSPVEKAPPDIWRQDDPEIRPPRFHLLVTGRGCLTHFLRERFVELEVPTNPTSDLYRVVSEQVQGLINAGALHTVELNSCLAVEWDWWELHAGVQATAHEWRFLIRVVETDHLAPQTDLRKVIRTQSQVYAPAEFGW